VEEQHEARMRKPSDGRAYNIKIRMVGASLGDNKRKPRSDGQKMEVAEMHNCGRIAKEPHDALGRREYDALERREYDALGENTTPRRCFLGHPGQPSLRVDEGYERWKAEVWA